MRTQSVWRIPLRRRLATWLWYWWLRLTPRTRCSACGSDNVLVGLATVTGYGATTMATWKQPRYYCHDCKQEWLTAGDRTGSREEHPRVVSE